ncbi:hypothetical protein [uncultured Enterovirga sp.]|uniref:hypothetical protein n=1 Tax=uncultured Enterovirga sp. TaxID=2026352 RepID=UPI0035CBACF3
MPHRVPPLPPGYVPPARAHFRRGKNWRRYVPDVVERVRELIEGTTWPEAAIAERVGIAVATVHGWKVRRGWRQPPDASVSTRKVGIERAGFTRRWREALRDLEALAFAEAARLADEEPVDQAALSRAVAIIVAAQRAARPPRQWSNAPGRRPAPGDTHAPHPEVPSEARPRRTHPSAAGVERRLLRPRQYEEG